MITDTHTHVYWKSYDEDREAALARARAAGVERMLVVGTDLASSRLAFELCAGRAGLYPTAGIHPHDARPAAEAAEERAGVRALCERRECVAVGETGLDYFKGFSAPEAQRESFAWHLELARELDKPVIVHCRDAHADASRMLRESGVRRGVMHCYSLGLAELPAYVELGLCISFAGILTYPKNDALRAAAAAVPDEQLLVETDSPYLPPQAQRGRRNEPALVCAVVEELARVRGSTRAAIAELTSANAARLFRLA